MAQGPATHNEKEIKTRWPVTEGIIAETTKQTGRKMTLTAEKGSNVPRREKAGMLE